jgi:TPR repeat protein
VQLIFMPRGTYTTKPRTSGSKRTLLALLAATLPTTALALATTSDVEALLKERRFFAATEQATELIQQGGLSGAALGRVHLLRGQALFERLRSREAEADFLRARELVPQGTDKGNETAYWLGRSYARNGNGTDKQRALDLLGEAARGGIADADYEIGALYGDPAESAEGLRALQRASRKGVVRATVSLARMSSDGDRRTQNPGEAARLYRLAAQRGDAEARYQLALAYRDGYGVPRDLAASLSWQEKALAQGHAGAHLVQGGLLERTAGEEVRLAQYHYWRAAQGGLPAGMINIGLAYLRGRGVEQDWEEAAHWLSRAGGVPMADFYYGSMSLYGLGIPRNDQQAFSALQRAANVLPDAKAILAGLYQNGLGVDRDTVRAQRLLGEVLLLDDASSMRTAAWMLATSERPEMREPTFARRLAERSLQLDASSDTQVLAAALASGGEFERAAEAQQRALAGASEQSRELRQQRLMRYEARQLWTEPFQPEQEATAARESQTKQVATFIGEVVQLGPAPAGRRPPGYEIGSDAAFVIRVLVEKAENGTLPHFMQESAVFYIHSPTELFADLPQSVSPVAAPVGPRRFVLTEVEDNGWSFELSVAALDSSPAPSPAAPRLPN